MAAWGKTERTYRTHSVRKSFMSALIGMAVAEARSIFANSGRAWSYQGNDADRSGEAGTRNRSARHALAFTFRQQPRCRRCAMRVRLVKPRAPYFLVLQQHRLQRAGHNLRQATGEDIFGPSTGALPVLSECRITALKRASTRRHLCTSSSFSRVGSRSGAVWAVVHAPRSLAGSATNSSSLVEASVRSFSGTGDQGSRVTKSGYGQHVVGPN